MKKLLVAFALLVLAGVPAKAQESRVDVGGGYTYHSWDFAGYRMNMNGWNATASFNVNNWLTAAADFDGTYNSNPTGDAWLETFMAGPRVYPMGHHTISPFVHVLVGSGHAKINISGGGSASDTAFAFEAGGGVDVNVTRHIAVRVGEFD